MIRIPNLNSMSSTESEQHLNAGDKGKSVTISHFEQTPYQEYRFSISNDNLESNDQPDRNETKKRRKKRKKIRKKNKYAGHFNSLQDRKYAISRLCNRYTNTCYWGCKIENVGVRPGYRTFAPRKSRFGKFGFDPKYGHSCLGVNSISKAIKKLKDIYYSGSTHSEYFWASLDIDVRNVEDDSYNHLRAILRKLKIKFEKARYIKTPRGCHYILTFHNKHLKDGISNRKWFDLIEKVIKGMNLNYRTNAELKGRPPISTIVQGEYARLEKITAGGNLARIPIPSSQKECDILATVNLTQDKVVKAYKSQIETQKKRQATEIKQQKITEQRKINHSKLLCHNHKLSICDYDIITSEICNDGSILVSDGTKSVRIDSDFIYTPSNEHDSTIRKNHFLGSAYFWVFTTLPDNIDIEIINKFYEDWGYAADDVLDDKRIRDLNRYIDIARDYHENTRLITDSPDNSYQRRLDKHIEFVEDMDINEHVELLKTLINPLDMYARVGNKIFPISYSELSSYISMTTFINLDQGYCPRDHIAKIWNSIADPNLRAWTNQINTACYKILCNNRLIEARNRNAFIADEHDPNPWVGYVPYKLPSRNEDGIVTEAGEARSWRMNPNTFNWEYAKRRQADKERKLATKFDRAVACLRASNLYRQNKATKEQEKTETNITTELTKKRNAESITKSTHHVLPHTHMRSRSRDAIEDDGFCAVFNNSVEDISHTIRPPPE